MTRVDIDWEGVPDGTTITPANAGVDTVSIDGANIFRGEHESVYAPEVAALYNASPAGGHCHAIVEIAGAEVWAGIWLHHAQVSSASSEMLQFRTAGGSIIGEVVARANGTWRARGSSDVDSSWVAPANTKYKVLARCDTAAGTLQVRLYADENTDPESPDETLTVACPAGTAVGQVTLGNWVGAANTRDITINHWISSDEGWPAPAAPPPDPVADAGADQSVANGTTGITLDFGGSTPGTPGNTLTYAVTQPGGPTVTLSGTGSTRTFDGLAPESETIYTFELTVTEVETGRTDTDFVQVTEAGTTSTPLSGAYVWRGDALTRVTPYRASELV